MDVVKFLTPKNPQVPALEHDQGPVQYALISFICENINKVWYKKSLKLTL